MATYQEIFERFSKCELSTKMKQGGQGTLLRYASWTEVWEQILKIYPNSDYDIVLNENGDIEWKAGTGSLVRVKMTIEGNTREMWLAVSDSANRALPNTTIDRKTGEVVEHPITSTDISNTLMRCLCKCAAMFGLGLYIYAGEDAPESVKEEAQKALEEAKNSRRKDFESELDEVTDRASFEAVMLKYQDLLKDPFFLGKLKDLSKKYPKEK